MPSSVDDCLSTHELLAHMYLSPPEDPHKDKKASMSPIAVTNNMNTDAPSAPRNRDQQQHKVDFSSRAQHAKGSSGGEEEGGASGGGYDSRYPNLAFHQHSNKKGKDDPPASFLQTPAQLPRDQLKAATNYDFTMTTSTAVSKFGPRLNTHTPGNFAYMGQTPMTGASLGSNNDPTPRAMTGSSILKPSNFKTATGNALDNASDTINAGISAMGLVRGNNPLGPTPLVRRNDPGGKDQSQQQLPTPSPGMHYHLPAASSMKTFEGLPPTKKRGQSSVDEEDPAMLRYASTAGSDQSPLIAKGTNSDQMDEIEASRTPHTHPQVLPDGILRDPSAPSYGSGRPRRENQNHPQSNTPAALTEFPYYFDGYAAWLCRHCSHISPLYRTENYIWHYPQAPPNEFVDQHLIVCPGLNIPSSVSHRPPPLPAAGSQYEQQPTSKNSHDVAPDPPTGRSPPMSLHQKVAKSNQQAQQYFPGQLYPPMTQAYSMMPTQQLGKQPQYMMPPHGAQQPPFPFGLSGTVDPSPARAKPKRRSTGKNVSPKGRPSDDDTYMKAIEHLEEVEELAADLTQANSDIGSSLVEPSDSELITDYFFHIMKQLVVCRFAEKDRKTRGGKRENINIGYGGLQCRHCISGPSSRKFFWSNVDRLANSFAEIPTHVLKCKSTPEDVRDALLILKGKHSSQMQSLARGSQKVFFRRMWRRLHDGDETNGATPISNKPSRDDSEASNGSDNVSKSSGSRPNATRMLAETLAAESLKTASRDSVAMNLAEPGNTTTSDVVLLAISEDKDWLSDDQCFVRSNIEVFVATDTDAKLAVEERKYPIKPGWVGLRCVHCAKTPSGARDTAVCYPYSVSGIYESVKEFQRMHFEKCPNLPPDIIEASRSVNKASTTLSSVLRRYYVQSAKALGLVDMLEGGITAGAKVRHIFNVKMSHLFA